MSLSNYLRNIEDRVPVSFFAVLERGAIVNGDQSGTDMDAGRSGSTMISMTSLTFKIELLRM